MAECFIYGQSGNSDNNLSEPFVLFEGFEDNYQLADGFTGFVNTDSTVQDSDCKISEPKSNESGSDLNKYGYVFYKSWAISSGSDKRDSAVFISNEKIDLTPYSYIFVEFNGYANIGSLSREKAKSYFKVDIPTTLPESKVAYNWSEWDDMEVYYNTNGKYYYNISTISGEHNLCFGVYHGNYDAAYNNGIKIYKIELA